MEGRRPHDTYKIRGVYRTRQEGLLLAAGFWQKN